MRVYGSSSVDPVKVEHAGAITTEYLDSTHIAWFWGGLLFGPIGLLAVAALGDRKLRHHIRLVAENQGVPREAFSPATQTPETSESTDLYPKLKCGHSRPAPMNASSTSARAAVSKSMSAMVLATNSRVIRNHSFRVADRDQSSKPSRMKPSGQMPLRVLAISTTQQDFG